MGSIRNTLQTAPFSEILTNIFSVFVIPQAIEKQFFESMDFFIWIKIFSEKLKCRSELRDIDQKQTKLLVHVSNDSKKSRLKNFF